MLKIGLSKTIITPPLGTDLVGYFNHRPANGVLDDLHLRVMLLEQEGITAGFLVYDLCFLTAEFVDQVRSSLKEAGFGFADNLSLSAIHTHTGPSLCTFFGIEPVPSYVSDLVHKSVEAVREAAMRMAPAELSVSAVDFNPYAFVRRYWMKNGKVVTNPGRFNPDIVAPESEFDHTVSVLAVKQEGRISALMVNLANHTDTIGGEMISADWPGRMEREIQHALTEDIPVFTLIDCSGDINHFDVYRNLNQTCYAEAVRIGRGYAGIILALLETLKPVPTGEISVKREIADIRFRDIPATDVEAAKATLDRMPKTQSDSDMTSEGIASGDGAVARFFAENLIEYSEKCSGRSRKFELLSIRIGKELAFTTIPGEGFNGISRAIRSDSPYKHTFVITLGQGEAGYIAMPECVNRGGYEVMPVVNSTPHEQTAQELIALTMKNLS